MGEKKREVKVFPLGVDSVYDKGNVRGHCFRLLRHYFQMNVSFEVTFLKIFVLT